MAGGAAKAWMWWRQEREQCLAGWTLATLDPSLLIATGEMSGGAANWASLCCLSSPPDPAPTTTEPGMSAGWPWQFQFGLVSVSSDLRSSIQKHIWSKWNGGTDFITWETGLCDHSHLPLPSSAVKIQLCSKCFSGTLQSNSKRLQGQSRANTAMLLHSSHIRAPHTKNLFWVSISQVKRTDLKTQSHAITIIFSEISAVYLMPCPMTLMQTKTHFKNGSGQVDGFVPWDHSKEATLHAPLGAYSSTEHVLTAIVRIRALPYKDLSINPQRGHCVPLKHWPEAASCQSHISHSNWPVRWGHQYLSSLQFNKAGKPLDQEFTYWSLSSI